MKKLKTSVAFIAAILISTQALSCKRPEPANNGKGFAVLELFTSEGCSSCPPAEELLAEIAAKADSNVFVLGYHVDYWDRLGWKDAFSDASFSKRQYDYSSHLGSEVYTPQLVINGSSECIGSDKTAVHNAIDKSLRSNPTRMLDLQGEILSGKMNINYQVNGDVHKEELVLVVVQRHAVSKVRAGENEGRTLSHAQIVRKLYHFDLKKEQATITIDLPTEFDLKSWEVIGWLQEQGTGGIKAATRLVVKS